MFTEIQVQASKLWKTLSDPKTLETYQQALGLTWTMIQEAARLLWLILCLGIVWLAWGWAASIWAGRNMRTFVAEVSQPNAETVTNQFGKVLLMAGQQTFSLALNTAKNQLGITTSPIFMEALEPAKTSSNALSSQAPVAKAPEPEISPTATPSAVPNQPANPLETPVDEA